MIVRTLQRGFAPTTSSLFLGANARDAVDCTAALTAHMDRRVRLRRSMARPNAFEKTIPGMFKRMALPTKGNQVFEGVISAFRNGNDMMNIKAP